MKKVLALMLACLAALMTGCGTVRPERAALLDLGPSPSTPVTQGLPALPPISIADVSVPGWLDRPQMFYRLDYENDVQPRSYAHSRWTMPPAQLLVQRLKAHIAQAGGAALSSADGAIGVPILRIEVDDFSQHFAAPERSTGRVVLRASVFSGRSFVAQRTFVRQAPAPSADAEGGARALAQATDAAVADVMQWLATLPLQAIGRR